MKKKLLACLLFLFPIVAFAGHAHAETIKVVFDTAYAPFEFKDLSKSQPLISATLSKISTSIPL